MGFSESYLTGYGMWFLHMHDVLNHLAHWENLVPAVLVTVGVGLLIGCSVGCICSPCEEEDDLFHREVS
jgi:hypothetical protein